MSFNDRCCKAWIWHLLSTPSPATRLRHRNHLLLAQWNRHLTAQAAQQLRILLRETLRVWSRFTLGRNHNEWYECHSALLLHACGQAKRILIHAHPFKFKHVYKFTLRKNKETKTNGPGWGVRWNAQRIDLRQPWIRLSMSLESSLCLVILSSRFACAPSESSILKTCSKHTGPKQLHLRSANLRTVSYSKYA